MTNDQHSPPGAPVNSSREERIPSEESAEPGGVRVVVRFRSGHRLELCLPEGVSSGGGSYLGVETVVTLTGPHCPRAYRRFASAAELLQHLGLPIATRN